MCDCFARVFGVSWSPATSAAAEGHAPESHVSRARRQVPRAESPRNDQPAQGQSSTGPRTPLQPEDAGDPDRAAQKEKLHAELKRVLQRKGARQASSEEAEAVAAEAAASQAPGAAEAQPPKMERTPERPELLEVIVETEAEAGVSGMRVAGGGKQGLFVKAVLKGSPAARAFSLREGDQLLSARVYFDNMKYEDALQILKSAEPYKVSFCLKRTVPSPDRTHGPGAPAALDGRGPKAKMAKLSIHGLTSLKKKPKKAGTHGRPEPEGSKLEVAPVDVEFSLPKFSKLRKARSAGEVAAAQPSPDLSPLLSSLETKRRRLKLPRLKVKEALAARAVGRLDGAPPKAAHEGAGVKASRFSAPFSKGKKPKEEVVGFQAPQVELDFPVPKARPGQGSPKATALHVPPFELPKVEVVLPKGSPAGSGGPEEGSPARLRLPTAEVAAPQVAVGLSLPRPEGPPPEVALRGEGFFQIKVPRVGDSAEGAERKPALLDVVLGKGRSQAEALGGQVAMPSLEVGLPPVDVEIPLPRGQAEAEAPKPRVEIPNVSLKVPAVSLPKLGSKPQEEVEESRVPQVELSVGKLESPRAKAKSQTPSVGISLMERKSESPAESKTKSLGLKVPSLDISAPSVAGMQLSKALLGLAAPALEVKAEEAREGPRFNLQMSLPAKVMPSPPQAPKKPEGNAGGKAGAPALEVQLPKGHMPKPGLDLGVDRPQLEVALPTARLSFPSAAAPALVLDLPRPGVELGLPTVDGECLGSDHEARLKMPTLETLSKDLDLEISIPQCRGEAQSEQQPGAEASEGPGVGAIVARIPKVDLGLGQEAATEAHKGPPEWEESAKGGEFKLPSVELPAVKSPQVTTERGKSPKAEAKLKPPKFALPKFSLSGPKAWKVGTELFGTQGEGPDAADRGAKPRMPKFGISFPKPRAGAEAESPKPGPERRSPGKEQAEGSRQKLPSVALPKVEVELPSGLPTDKEGGLLELAIEPPDLRRKMPKLSLPQFGGRGKEGGVELETREAQAKASKFKVALLSMAGRDLEGAGPEGGAKARKEAESPKEKPRGPLLKMPKLKLPSPKADLGQGHIPQVELPKISFPEGAKAEETLLGGSESPTLKVRVPSLEIAVPGATATAEPARGRPRAEAVGAELKLPQVPSLGISVPQVELGLSLPTVGAQAPMPQGVPGAEAKIRLPQVELPPFGRGEATDLHLSSRRGGEQGAGEGAKTRVPGVDLSLPQTRLPEGEGEAGTAVGLEGRLQLPSVELPIPRGRAPEQEGSPGGARTLSAITLSGPAVRLSKSRGPSLEGDRGTEASLPQLELKLPNLGGSAEGAAEESWGSCPPSSFGLCQAEGEATAAAEVAATFGPDSKFKLKLPSLGLSKGGPEPRADTQPLCPPLITLPEVGFSVGQVSQSEAQVEAGKMASGEGLEGKGAEARLKMPQIKLPALGGSVPKGGREAAAAPQEPGRKRAAFRVLSGLELAAPSLKGHAEYGVEGAQLQELEAAGRGGRQSPGGRGEAPEEEEAGKKYKVKIPKFGLPLPKAGEGVLGQEGEAQAKRPAFARGRPKGRGAEGSSGLLEGDEEEGGGRGVMHRFRQGLSRLKMGSEANGELEPNGASKMKLPKLGFSNGEEAEGDGAQDKLGKIRLPQVELSSPSTPAESDPELSLKLARAEGPKEEEEEESSSLEGAGAWVALKFKPPRITFSGFKKRNGEPAPGGAVVSSAARTEMASLERGGAALKGEKSPKFKFPKVALGPKSHGVLEITSKAGQAGGGAERPLAQGGLL